jgi:hypothetical protein
MVRIMPLELYAQVQSPHQALDRRLYGPQDHSGCHGEKNYPSAKTSSKVTMLIKLSQLHL